MNSHPSSTVPRTSVASLVQQVAGLLTGDGLPVGQLFQLLGDVKRKHAGSGYYLLPRDQRVASVWVGVRVVMPEQEDVTHVQLEIKGENELTLGQLNRVFGTWSSLPPAAKSVRHTVAYYPEPPPQRSCSVALFAETEDAPKSESVSVRTVILRRDLGASA